MSRGGWPPCRPPTHFVQHSHQPHRNVSRVLIAPLGYESQPSGARAPCRTTHRACHQYCRGLHRPAASRSRHPRQKERSSGSTTRVRIITWHICTTTSKQTKRSRQKQKREMTKQTSTKRTKPYRSVCRVCISIACFESRDAS